MSIQNNGIAWLEEMSSTFKIPSYGTISRPPRKKKYNRLVIFIEVPFEQQGKKPERQDARVSQYQSA
jgi:hypothetical protein